MQAPQIDLPGAMSMMMDWEKLDQSQQAIDISKFNALANAPKTLAQTESEQARKLNLEADTFLKSKGKVKAEFEEEMYKWLQKSKKIYPFRNMQPQNIPLDPNLESSLYRSIP